MEKPQMELTEPELVLLIQLSVKNIVEKQSQGQNTPFETALHRKLLAEREDRISQPTPS